MMEFKCSIGSAGDVCAGGSVGGGGGGGSGIEGDGM